MKKVLVPLAPGFEEIEAITVIDILRRAGVEVTVAGTQSGPIEASRKTKHIPDCALADVHAEDFDMLVLPGGQPGATSLRNDARLRQIVETLRAGDRYLAAICAAPIVLSTQGILKDRTATSHPTVRAEVAAGAKDVSDQRVLVDGPIITSQAAGTAMEFAFKLVDILCGPDKVVEVNRGVLARL
ncbi:MAG TPA: DJ-1 family glyoxalase III [Verrucomicrobiae bacterium]|nr:DJ-1 family glyoxalase III [Verrucomicrobiae bacterium]